MIKANYHTHSCYCDGKETLRQYVETAVERGFTHLGFSGHAPVPFENSFAIANNRYLDYCNEVRLLKEEFADRMKIFLIYRVCWTISSRLWQWAVSTTASVRYIW